MNKQTIAGIFAQSPLVSERLTHTAIRYGTTNLSEAANAYWAYRGKSLALQRAIEQIPQPIRVLHSPLFGVEVETENIVLKREDDKVPAGWQTRGDGSLRHGVEYVSLVADPAEMRELIGSLYLFLIEGLRKSPTFSWRTSIHVHVNVRRFNLEQLTNLQLLYSIFEFLLFKFVDESRQDSIFCVPITKTPQHLKIRKLMQAANSSDISDQIVELATKWEKYSALNFSRLGDLGTVEFRHMSGTWDVKKIGNWLNIISALQDAACRLEQDWIIEQIRNLNSLSNYGEFKNKVFGTELSQMLGEASSFMQLLSHGVSWAKKCIEIPPVFESRVEKQSEVQAWIDLVRHKITHEKPLQEPSEKTLAHLEEVAASLGHLGGISHAMPMGLHTLPPHIAWNIITPPLVPGQVVTTSQVAVGPDGDWILVDDNPDH